MQKQPRLYNLMNELENNGSLQTLIDGAVISTSVLMHYNISKRMKELIERRKNTKRFILVGECCDEFKVSHIVVYRAMQTFEIIKR